MPKEYKYRKSIVIGHKPDGTQIRKVIRSDSKKEFVSKCRYYEALYAKGVDISSNLTVEEWAWMWYKTYKEDHVGASQRRNLEIIIRKHICPAIGFMPLRDVRQLNIQQFINSLSGQSKSQIVKIRGTLKQIFEQAYNNNKIESNPVKGITMPESTESHRRALTANEQKTLLAVCKTHRGGLWVRLMLECGLRRGETIPLRWGDIDFEHGILTINKAAEFVSKKNAATEKSTKTESGERKVPIPPDLLRDLDAVKRKTFDLVFHNKDGGMMSEQKVRTLWHSICRDWDIAMGAKLYRNKIVVHALDQDITPHYLRHTYATNLRRAGIDMKTAQYLLGHSDIRTTANIYSHVDDDDIKNVREKLFQQKPKRYKLRRRSTGNLEIG